MKLSSAMTEALRAVERGEVTYDMIFGVRGMRSVATLTALETRELVVIDNEHYEVRTRYNIYPVILTDKGREVLAHG